MVEVLSPDDRATEIQRKVLEYLRAGVRVVWVADPVNRTVTVFQPALEARVLGPEETLWAPGVLPDLATRVSELFPPLPRRA